MTHKVSLFATMILIPAFFSGVFGLSGQTQVENQAATSAATSVGTASATEARVSKLAVVGTDARHTQPAIFIIDPNGKNPIALTNDNGSADQHPAWSPDGTKLAFVSEDVNSASLSVIVLQLGSPIKRTVVYPASKGAKSGSILLLSWSPDSTQIIFPVKATGVFIVNADGSQIQPVNFAGLENQSITFATWTVDGNHIQVLVGFNPYSANPDGSNVQKITAVETLRSLNLSPDGKTLLYLSDPPSLTGPSGLLDKNPRPVNALAGLDILVTGWSPDSKQVAVLGDNGNSAALYVVSADSAAATKIDTGSLTIVPGYNNLSWGAVPAEVLPTSAPGPTVPPTRTPIPSKTPKPSATPKTTATTVAAVSLAPLSLATLKPIEFADSPNPSSADMSADQKYVAAAVQGNSAYVVKMWDATTGTLVRTFDGGKYIIAVRFSPDGKLLLGHERATQGGSPTPIYVWDTATGKLLYTVQDGGANPVFSPDSKLLMSIGPLPQTGPFKIQTWDAATGANKAMIAFQEGLDVGDPLAFSPGGKSILIVSPLTATIVDSAKGIVKAHLPRVAQGQGPWDAAAWSPDGTSVLISEDTIPVLYDAKTFKEIRRFDNAQADSNSFPTSLNFSADGKYALTFSSNEFAARLWDVQTGKLVKVFNDDKYTGALLSPDGKFVLLTPLSQKPLQLVNSGI